MHRLTLAGLVFAAALHSPIVVAQQSREGGAAPSCGDPVAFQILLDKQSFSPGVIDGHLGANAMRALSAFQASRNLTVTGIADCATWEALGGPGEPVLVDYTISVKDAEGPFAREIPSDLMEQASLPALAYRSLEERLAEQFHAAPALLARLNPAVRLAEGATIKVPAVTPFDASAKPEVKNQNAPAEQAEDVWSDVRVEVSAQESALRVLRADGTLAMFAPVTSGSEHDPLPVGDWQVTSVTWMPKFHYNPALFWDAEPSHSKATLPPGPNSPVGVVWIDINVEHYGLHGTPEPSRVGHAQSHGCVRLTNWDAARLATLVRSGTPVIFK